MKKDELIKELDNLIEDSEGLRISFLYDHCLDSLKQQLDEVKFNEFKKEYKKQKKGTFSELYQKWYAKAFSIIQRILPERKLEFEKLYLPLNNRKELTLLNYTIFDAIRGIHNEYKKIRVDSASNLLDIQIDIVKSVKEVIEHKLNEITSMLEFDVFEKEIDSARFLLKNKYLRSAGAICGVILEKHLLSMLVAAGEKPTKKNPALNDLNDDLYNKKIIDSTQFKFLLFLGDIRNKCDHNKTQDPTKEEVEDLINGTEKVIKTY